MSLHDFVIRSYQQGGIDFLEKCLRNDQSLMKTFNLVDYLNQVSSTL